VRWETKWRILLVISVPKIFVNGQFYFNLLSKMWSRVFLEHSVGLYKINTEESFKGINAITDIMKIAAQSVVKLAHIITNIQFRPL